jgi:hypothetical protein
MSKLTEEQIKVIAYRNAAKIEAKLKAVEKGKKK